MTRILLSSVAAAAMLASASGAQAQTEIQWWHAMGGNLGETVNEIAAGFNKTQTEYKVVPSYKGSYPETLTAAIAAFRAKQGPHIVQVFEVGTANMMAAKGAIYPIYQLMADAKEPFDPKAFIGPVYGYYSTTDGKLLSMPFNSSTPVLFWNKELLAKAGYDPWHNLPYATKANGFGGTDIELKFNDAPRIKLIQMMADWTKDKTFVYGGREGKSDTLFNGGECAFRIGSSGSAAGAEKALGADKVGMGMMPYSPDVIAKPQNSIIGGATLWVLQGRPKDEYKGVAKFMTFLSSTPVQAKWHQETGYVPITTAAAELTEKEGFYKKFPGRDIAVKELTLNPPTDNSKGLRIGNFVQIRDVVDEELESVWSGKKDAKTALDEAVKRGNELLRKFEAANK